MSKKMFKNTLALVAISSMLFGCGGTPASSVSSTDAPASTVEPAVNFDYSKVSSNDSQSVYRSTLKESDITVKDIKAWIDAEEKDNADKSMVLLYADTEDKGVFVEKEKVLVGAEISADDSGNYIAKEISGKTTVYDLKNGTMEENSPSDKPAAKVEDSKDSTDNGTVSKSDSKTQNSSSSNSNSATQSSSSSNKNNSQSSSSSSSNKKQAIVHPAEYKTVHHNAEYKTVHHDAEYQTVHHDAEYQTVHHDAVYETVHHDGYYQTTDGSIFATDDEALKYCADALRAGMPQNYTCIASWDEQVCVSNAWDEQVETKAAWDEQVLVKDAWDEQVIVKDAWDEQVLVKESWTEYK